MLPFRDQKSRTSRSEEIELEDDDLVILDGDVEMHPSSGGTPPHAAHAAPASVRAPSSIATYVPHTAHATLPSTGSGARRKHTVPPGSRRVVEERVEEDVAGQCLASLAESRAHSSSHVRAAFARPSVDRPSAFSPPPPATPANASAGEWEREGDRAPGSVSRLPAVSSPPSRSNIRPFSGSRPARASEEAPGVRDSSPPAAFVRRSSASFPAATPSAFTNANARPSSVNSLAPVSASVLPNAYHAASATPPEHTLIVVRERPRAAWIFAAAALGALGAIAATRFLSAGDASAARSARSHTEERGQTAVTTLSTASPAVGGPAPPPAVVAPPPPAPAPALSAVPARPGPAVMSFADDQGVAIKAPAPRAPASAAAAAPRAPRAAAPSRLGLGPALPDGSLSLGPSSSSPSPSQPSRASSNAVAPSAPAPVTPVAPVTAEAPPPPPRKPRVLTPEQQLAEAQLKASMK